MELPLAFFFGDRAQVIAGKVVSQQFYIVGQCNVRAAAVGRVQHLHTDGDDGIVLTVHAGKRGCGAVGIEQSLIQCDLNRAVGIVVTVILIAPTLDADFCLTGQHRQTVGVEVVPGSRLRQAGIHPRLDFFHGQPAVRCRRLFCGCSAFRCGGFGCLRRGWGLLCKSRQRCAQICERNPTRQQQRQALLYSVFVLHTNFSFCCKRKSPLRVAAGLVSVRERVS